VQPLAEGDSSPSPEDLEITEKLMKAGDELGIKVLDHVIVGKEEFWSWREKPQR
jgi:DNA repair protein RadC